MFFAYAAIIYEWMSRIRNFKQLESKAYWDRE
jgi:hypothetical protein